MSDVQLDTFPSNSVEALTMLYLQNQDLTALTPEELVKKYAETYSEIRHAMRTAKSQKWFF